MQEQSIQEKEIKLDNKRNDNINQANSINDHDEKSNTNIEYHINNKQSLYEVMANILACPKCKQKIAIDVVNHKVICSTCMIFFPIKDQIPIMLLSQSQALTSS